MVDETAHGSTVCCLAVLGASIVTGAGDRRLRLFAFDEHACTIEPVRVFEGHRGIVRCVAATRDMVVSGSDDNTIRVWSMSSGACLRTLVGHKFWVNAIRIDGTRLVSGSNDKTIRMWHFDDAEPTGGPDDVVATVRASDVTGSIPRATPPSSPAGRKARRPPPHRMALAVSAALNGSQD